MRKRGARLLIGLVALAAGVGSLAAVARAERGATAAQTRAIKPVAMKACGEPRFSCKWKGARVSTVDPRYAFGQAVSQYGFAGVLVRRSSSQPLRYHVVRTIGGGIGPCLLMPLALRRVMADLKICLPG